jgi:hypothetical protein
MRGIFLRSSHRPHRDAEECPNEGGTRRRGTGAAMVDRATEFDYGAARLIDTHDRILRSEAAATALGEDMATAWGLAYTVTRHARTLLNSATVEDWDLDTLEEDDYARRTAIIYNGWMAGEAFLIASGISRTCE